MTDASQAPFVGAAENSTLELSGWKQIAEYLKVSVRTAQLWETERKLPVHRTPGLRGTRYASKEELERWKRSGDHTPQAPTRRPVTVRLPIPIVDELVSHAGKNNLTLQSILEAAVGLYLNQNAGKVVKKMSLQ